MYYISVLLILLLPLQNMVLLYDKHASHHSWAVFFFLPSLFISMTFLHWHIYKNWRIGTILAHVSATWAYTYALLSTLVGHGERWQATGTKGGVSRGFTITAVMATVYLFIYAIAVIVSIGNGVISLTDVHSAVLVFWMIVNLSVHSLYIKEVVRFYVNREKDVSGVPQEMSSEAPAPMLIPPEPVQA